MATETSSTPPAPPERTAQAASAGDGSAPDGTVQLPPPRLAEGIELIGRFEDSGFKDPPFIARRADGQVIQLPHLLYSVAEHADGRRGHDEIAERVSHAFERHVKAGDVRFLLEEKLVPLGVIAPPDGARQPLRKADPLLALKFRTGVIPDRAVRAITTVFKPLFLPPVVVAVVAGLLALDGWLFFEHGISQSLRTAIYQPAVLLLLFGGVVLATAFHEVGHATACRYGGAKPGVMGVGIYIVWPAFFTDVTDAYRLGRAGRLRTDMGGIYFNAIFALGVVGVYALTRFEPLLLLIVIQNFAIFQQLLPLLRLDGYYIISDLTGVPDMFSRIRPTLASLIPGRKMDPRVSELKPRARGVVVGYVMLVVPIMAFSLLMMLVQAPRVFATAYDSVGVRYDAASAAFGHGKPIIGVTSILQMAALVLPALGVVLTTGRVSRRVGGAAWSWSEGDAARRALVVGPTLAGVATAAFLWWPNGDYKPIQPHERGTIQGGLQSLKQIPSGRPSLTPQRARQLGGAPTRRSLEHRGALTRRPTRPEGRPGSTAAPAQGQRTQPQRTTSTGQQTPQAPGGSSSETQTQPQDQTQGRTSPAPAPSGSSGTSTGSSGTSTGTSGTSTAP